MSGPRLVMTLFEAWLMSCNSAPDSFPAPGSSRSIMYFGMVSPPGYPWYGTESISLTYHWYVTMHTVSTNVKSPVKVKDKRVAQGDATRAALIEAARGLFGEKGYVDTSNDEVVARAGVTKGALYHHFSGKEELFRVVFEQVQQEVSDQAVVEFLLPDSWEALVRGCARWVDAHLDPSVRRIVMQDAPAVLGWDEVRTIENRFGAVALRGALRKAMHAGVLEQQPLRH